VKYAFDDCVEDGLGGAAALEHLRKLVEDPLGAGIVLPAMAASSADETSRQGAARRQASAASLAN
jgi:hypothetical protein